MNAQMSKDCVRHVTIEIACDGLAIGATGFEQFRISSEGIGYSMLVVKAVFPTIPAAIDADAAGFNGDLLSCNIFDFVNHSSPPRMGVCSTVTWLNTTHLSFSRLEI